MNDELFVIVDLYEDKGGYVMSKPATKEKLKALFDTFDNKDTVCRGASGEPILGKIQFIPYFTAKENRRLLWGDDYPHV